MITVNKNNLKEYSELVNNHMDLLKENNKWRIMTALSKCWGDLHYHVDNIKHLEKKIYN